MKWFHYLLALAFGLFSFITSVIVGRLSGPIIFPILREFGPSATEETVKLLSISYLFLLSRKIQPNPKEYIAIALAYGIGFNTTEAIAFVLDGESILVRLVNVFHVISAITYGIALTRGTYRALSVVVAFAFNFWVHGLINSVNPRVVTLIPRFPNEPEIGMALSLIPVLLYFYAIPLWKRINTK